MKIKDLGYSTTAHLTPAPLSAIFKSDLMKNLSGQQSLWVVFPILIVTVLLIAGIILLPTIQTEIRSRASEPTPTPISRTQAPEVVCSDLYTPVCDSDGQTYANACEANLAGITVFAEGECVRQVLPSTN